ncbi:hypothetical protein CEB3_c05910 [Peptococcaceae bacterium CEB3]|nr:hypothetical protein CEB3_c05910 [Peptococcaceae bacterium CEB3]
MDTETRELLRRFRVTLRGNGLSEAQCQARLAQVMALHRELERDLAGILLPAPKAYDNDSRNVYAMRQTG